MKKILIITLAFLLVFSLSACNAKEKVAEKVVEDIINSDSDSDVDVDFDGDQMTISDDEGNSMTAGGTEWPSGDAAKLIPECKSGNVVYVLEMTGTVNITMEDITEDEYNAYVQQVKNAGFTEEVTTMSSDEFILFSASDKNGANLAVYFYAEDNSMVVTVMVAE